MSASAVVRSLLGSTALLFDRSDEVCDETRRLARAVAGRRATGDGVEVKRLCLEGIDGGALVTAAGDDQLLARIVHDARSAATNLAAMQTERDLVVAARREAMCEKEGLVRDSRSALAVELKEASALVSGEYLTELRVLAGV